MNISYCSNIYSNYYLKYYNKQYTVYQCRPLDCDPMTNNWASINFYRGCKFVEIILETSLKKNYSDLWAGLIRLMFVSMFAVFNDKHGLHDGKQVNAMGLQMQLDLRRYTGNNFRHLQIQGCCTVMEHHQVLSSFLKVVLLLW